jgi:hypothetical protein
MSYCKQVLMLISLTFDERGGTNLQSRLLMGYVGSLAIGVGYSSHGQEVTSLRLLLLRSQWQRADDVNDSLLL